VINNKLAIFAVALVAAAAGVWLNNSTTIEPNETVATDVQADRFESLTLINKPRALPEFSLINHDGSAFVREDFQGQWTLVFSGFTSCGHFCPMTMAKIRTIYEQTNNRINVVFLSVDPGRDTPAVIKNYVKGYNEAFVGITGEKTEIDKLTKALEAPYVVNTANGSYTVDHASDLFLIDPQGRYAGFISQPLDIPLVSRELLQLL